MLSDPTTFVKDEERQRHEAERVKNGFSVFDWWNFDAYLSWVIVQGLEKFKNGAGFPGNLGSMEEWIKTLDKIIDGFKAKEALNNTRVPSGMSYEEWSRPLVEQWRAGAELFIEYYGSFWD